MRDLVQSDQYVEFIEELKATIAEGVKSYRATLIELYHEVGDLLNKNDGVSIQTVAKDSGLDERTLQRSLQFYKQFPNLEDVYQLEDGQNISWHKIVNKYLPTHKEQKAVSDYTTCPTCEGSGKVLNENKDKKNTD